MDDKLKIFWNLEVLVKMSRSKNDGPSLRIEELEIETKIKSYQSEIDEIKSISEEENYDTSAEMADRNIEIITKKQIQVLRSELKEKNRELNDLKNEENLLYEKTNLLRENKFSQEKYIKSMQERVGELVDIDVLDRYNGLIAETTEKANQIRDELEQESSSYKEVQEKIIDLTEKIKDIEETIAKKKSLLSETQAHLENKENYIDRTKTEKNNKRIADLEGKISKLNARLEVLRKDAKYLETKIKDVINNKESKKKAKPYLVELINQVISIPYINVPTDNVLEEELLRATQARDSFANEIDQKTYNILEADTPEKLRIEFLTDRIAKWKEQLEQYNVKISEIDHDEQYNYERKERILSVMINTMKNDVKEFERAYEDIPESNIGAKASIKAALDEKKEDLIEAEKIATLFRKDESDDIAHATRTIKYECDQLNKNIIQANDEIQKITNRLTSKKSGLIDISSRNKDKDILKELAQIVIDIKHRRQFPETPLEIVNRLEEDLEIDLKDSIDMETIDATSFLTPKDYEEYYSKNTYNIDEPEYNTNNEDEDEDSDDNTSLDKFNEAYSSLIDSEDNQEEDQEDNQEDNQDEYRDEVEDQSIEEPTEEANDGEIAFEPEQTYDSIEYTPSEDEIIEHEIDDFYNNIEENEENPADEAETPEEEATEPEITLNEEPIQPTDLEEVTDLYNEEQKEEASPVEEPITDEVSPVEEIVIDEPTPIEEPVAEDPVPEEINIEEQVNEEQPVDEVNTEDNQIISETENIESIDNIELVDNAIDINTENQFEDQAETAENIDSIFEKPTEDIPPIEDYITDSEPVFEPEKVYDQSDIAGENPEETIEPQPVEPVTESSDVPPVYEEQANPFADINNTQEPQPESQSTELEPTPATEFAPVQPVTDFTSEPVQPVEEPVTDQAEPVNEEIVDPQVATEMTPMEFTPDQVVDPTIMTIDQPTFEQAAFEANQVVDSNPMDPTATVDQAENIVPQEPALETPTAYQDIEANDQYINIAELAGPPTEQTLQQPEMIELSPTPVETQEPAPVDYGNSVDLDNAVQEFIDNPQPVSPEIIENTTPEIANSVNIYSDGQIPDNINNVEEQPQS